MAKFLLGETILRRHLGGFAGVGQSNRAADAPAPLTLLAPSR
jgi:hypothetical protein